MIPIKAAGYFPLETTFLFVDGLGQQYDHKLSQHHSKHQHAVLVVVLWVVLQAAIDLLEEMSEAGLAMDAFTYAHAIEACCNGGNRVSRRSDVLFCFFPSPIPRNPAPHERRCRNAKNAPAHSLPGRLLSRARARYE